MAKLTLKATKKAVGIGTFVEKTIQFRDAEGNEFSGEVLIKIISHDEVMSAYGLWKIPVEKQTVDQLQKARLFLCVYEDEKNKFFNKLEDFNSVTGEIVDALYKVADEVLDFTGKQRISQKKTNSTVNSSSTESVEEPLQPQEET